MHPLRQVGLLVRSRYAVLYLLTHEEARVERELAAVAAEEGLTVWRWRSTSGLVRPGGEPAEGTTDPAAALRLVLGVPEPALFVFEDMHDALGDPSVRRLVRDLEPVLAARRQALVLVAPRLVLPVELEKDVAVLDVPLPDGTEMGALLDEIAVREGLTPDPEVRDLLVRSALGLTAQEARRAFWRTRRAGGSFTAADVGSVLDEKRRVLARTRFLEFWDRPHTLADVGGMDVLKEWLRARAAAFSDEARTFGLPTPRGLFLLGVQGCGKSLVAKAVAGLWQVPLLRLDVGAVFQVRDRTESALRETIRVAESLSPVVLWIDELEKGFLATRDDLGGRALGDFLTWMQEKTRPVFVVATANDVRSLPPELIRKGRFDEVFFVDLPNVHERLRILEIHLKRRGRDPDHFDLTALAEETDRFSGAEIEEVVVSGLFLAFAAGRDLKEEDLLQVIRDMVPLAVTMDDRLKELRDWARPRARRASADTRRVDFFQEWRET